MAPRTPADIGRDITEAQQRIVELKAELGNAPPKVLVLDNVINNGTATFEPRPHDTGSVDIEVRLPHSSTITMVSASEVARLRAWLNHYYPEAS